MAVVDVTNAGIHSLGLSREVTELLILQLGWHRPLDVLVFLRYAYDHRAESRASNVHALERKLRSTNGFGPKRTKLVIDALIEHSII